MGGESFNFEVAYKAFTLLLKKVRTNILRWRCVVAATVEVMMSQTVVCWQAAKREHSGIHHISESLVIINVSQLSGTSFPAFRTSLFPPGILNSLPFPALHLPFTHSLTHPPTQWLTLDRFRNLVTKNMSCSSRENYFQFRVVPEHFYWLIFILNTSPVSNILGACNRGRLHKIGDRRCAHYRVNDTELHYLLFVPKRNTIRCISKHVCTCWFCCKVLFNL